MAAAQRDDETDGDKFAKKKCTTPIWGTEAKSGAHLWCRTSASGDHCYLANNECCDRGPRIKCASCKTVVHTECLKILIAKKVMCRRTFLDAEDESYREQTEVKHHWIAKKKARGKCRSCSRTFGGKVASLLGDSIGMSCSWCKDICHNKEPCFNLKQMETENCKLGQHNRLIVPPTWIVKLPEQETENSKSVFAVKPIPSETTPLLVFINPKSGGNQGSRLLKTFQWLLNPRQIFDLTEGGPGLGLELYKRVPNLRILACGGDGTVGWVLSVLDKLKLCTSPPIAVLPLGTGNDLARALGWGGGYTDEPLKRILSSIEVGEIVKLDRWILNVTPNSKAESNNNDGGRKDLPLTVVNNYFSLGVDALIALEFHEAREANPKKFNSRIRNKMFYGQAGGKDLILRKWKDFSKFVTLECDGKDMTGKLKDLRVHAILFLNISSYGGGTKPWGGHNSFQVPSTEDGLIEVIGLTTYQLPLLQAGGHGSPIAQCRRAKLVTSCTIPVQVDGEPCRLGPSVIDVELLNTVNMIAKAKKHGAAAMRKASMKKISLPLKLISLSNYEAEHKKKAPLKEGATDFGQVTVSWNTDLAQIRPEINKLLEEKDNVKAQTSNKIQVPDGRNSRRGSRITSWWFLDSCSGAKFFRIHEAQEHLFYVNDVCDQELYILEEREPCDDVSNYSLKVGPDADDVSSRVSTSSSGRQSQESGDERSENISAVAQIEREPESAPEREPEPESGPEREPEPDYTPPATRQPTQIVVESDSEMADNEQEPEDEEPEREGKEKEEDGVMHTLELPEKKLSITSLKIDESEMDLMTAAKFGSLNRVAELHSAGCSLSEVDNEGRTALHHAVFIGNTDVVRYLAVYAPLSILDAQDSMMFHTALHKAALRGDRRMCSILVSAGASLDIRDKQGHTAKDLAEAVGDKNLAKYLETVAETVIL